MYYPCYSARSSSIIIFTIFFFYKCSSHVIFCSFYRIVVSGNTSKNSDYTVTGSLVVTFPIDDTTNKNIKLYILEDQIVEERETIILTIRDDAAFTTKADYSSHTVYIADDDGKIIGQIASYLE